MEESKFSEKVRLMLDPYYDREFFTNLIYCMDRQKTPREIFESAVQEIDLSPKPSVDLDRSLLHLFFSYQVSSLLRENYQWLPLANAVYTAALHRGDGQNPVRTSPYKEPARSASTLQEFESAIRKGVRAVESSSSVWAGFLFLLENRSTRSKAISALMSEALISSDALTFELLTRGLEVALSSGWKSNAILLRRPFDRFWNSERAPEVVNQGLKLSEGIPIHFQSGSQSESTFSYAEDLWKKISEQSAESAWDLIGKMAESGISYEQVMAVLSILRGRILFQMKTTQWPRVARSIVYAESLQAASQLAPEKKLAFLAINLFELTQTVQLLNLEPCERPTGQGVLDGVSKSISKDRLVLRIDDAIECGRRSEALEIMAMTLKDHGLSNSICDRLLLVASKQDAWTFDLRTIPVAYSVTKAFNACVRLGVGAQGDILADGLYGLLRFLCDERESSLMVVPKTGTYGNGLSLSQFDVSGGARIVDRFVFNQIRNAQRVKVWPSDN